MSDADPAVSEVAQDVYAVRLPLGTGFVASFLVAGERLCIIDSGVRGHPATHLAPAVARIGRSMNDVALVLATHGHPDHIGGHGELVAMSTTAIIGIGSSDLALLGGRAAVEDAPWEFAGLLDRLGEPERARDRRRQLDQLISGPVRCTASLTDGSEFDLGGVGVRVMATPGHTPGSISVLVGGDRILLVGDSVQGLGGSAGLPLYTDPTAFRRSLTTIGTSGAHLIGLAHPFRTSATTAHLTNGVLPAGEIQGMIAECLQFADDAGAAARSVVDDGIVGLRPAITAMLGRLPRRYAAGRTPADAGPATLVSALSELQAAGADLSASST